MYAVCQVCIHPHSLLLQEPEWEQHTPRRCICKNTKKRYSYTFELKHRALKVHNRVNRKTHVRKSNLTLWSCPQHLDKTQLWSCQTWRRSCVWRSWVFPNAQVPLEGHCPPPPPSLCHQPPGAFPARRHQEALKIWEQGLGEAGSTTIGIVNKTNKNWFTFIIWGF